MTSLPSGFMFLIIFLIILGASAMLASNYSLLFKSQLGLMRRWAD